MFKFGESEPRKTAFFIERSKHPIDVSKAPTDGYEYIHIQRIQNYRAKFNRQSYGKDRMPEKLSIRYQEPVYIRCGHVKLFLDMSKALISSKAELRKKFLYRRLPPLSDQVQCCIFCLGSKLCRRVYPSEIYGKSKAANSPLLSSVLYMTQNDILVLLQRMYEWYQIIGINDELGKWLYALLICLERPVSDECEEILWMFYTDFSRKDASARTSKKQYPFFCDILKCCFLVLPYTVEPPLEEFRY